MDGMADIDLEALHARLSALEEKVDKMLVHLENAAPLLETAKRFSKMGLPKLPGVKF